MLQMRVYSTYMYKKIKAIYIIYRGDHLCKT